MFLTVITPTLNSESTLGEALESVRSQWEEGIEHLVVDAVSKDGTPSVASRFPNVTFTSEPDEGIYDGMNKGALRAKGDWLLFLQGDDWLPEGTIKAYRQTVRANPGCEIVCGSAEALREASNGQQVVWKVWRNHDKKLTVNNIALGEPMINARLIRRNVFEQLGGFSKEYALASDRDFLIRAANMGIHQVEIEEMTYTYRWHSGSSTMTDECRLSNKLLLENLQIAKRHSQNMSGTAAKAILKWHSKLAVQGALTCLEKGEGEFIGFVTAGIKQDRMWPWIFLIEILACFPGFLMRGCRTRTSAKL